MKKILLIAAAFATLLTSCSKEEVVEKSALVGDAAFVASMNFDEDQPATRHHINSSNRYEWEAGDMVGVSTKNGGENIPFITKAGGEKAIFEAVGDDLAYLGEGPYYMGYPYGKNLTVDGTGKVEGLTVPAVQRYRANSFATMTAPALAVVDEFAAAGQEVEFYAAASMLKFHVYGTDKMQSLELSVDGEKLSGDFTAELKEVEIDGVKKTVIETEPSAGSATTVKVEFGKSPMGLNYRADQAVPVVFVINSGLTLKGKTLVLTATAKDGVTTSTQRIEIPNTAAADGFVEIPANALKNFTQARSFFFEGKYVIGGTTAEQAALDFITYAYFTQPSQCLTLTDPANPWDAETNPFIVAGTQIVGAPTPHDYNTLYANGYNQEVEALVVADVDLDLTKFNPQTMYNKLSQYDADGITALDQVYMNALTWYIKNGNAINSIKYNAVKGGNDEPVVINALKVKGNGITAGATLKGLKFTNTTVVAGENDDNVGFIAGLGNVATVEDVIIGSGNAVDATQAKTTAHVAGIASYVPVNQLKIDVTVEALPSIAHHKDQHVGQVYGYVVVNKNLAIDLADYKVSSLAEHPVVYEAVGDQVIDFTSTIADYDTESKYFGLIAKASQSTLSTYYPSLVVNNVSYWNGDKRVDVGGSDYFTAEELAAKLEDTNLDVVLTDNIDMQSIPTVFTAYHTRNTTIDGNSFTIKNVNAKPNANAEGLCTLFGSNANISNLTLSGIVINTEGYTADVKQLAGIATTGKASNVTVEDITINVHKDTPIAAELQSVGGVFAVANPSDINDVKVGACNITYAGETAKSLRTGVIVGTLNVETTSKGVTVGKFALNGPKAGYNFEGLAAGYQKKLENETTGINGYKSTNNYGGIYAFGTINVTNAGFAATHQEATLSLAEGSVLGWNTTKFAAGIVFNNELTSVAAGKVNYETSEAVYKEYDYVFITSAQLGAEGRTVIGFNKN